MRTAGLFLLLLAPAAFCADPITGPAEFKRDSVAVFKVDTGGKLLLKVPPGLSVAKSADGSVWYVAGKPGAYALTGNYFTVDFNAKTWDVVEVDVAFTITGDPDPPSPPPVPPAPGPQPAAPGAWVVVVVDEAAPKPSPVIEGPTLTALKAAGRCRVYGSVSDAEKLAAKRYTLALNNAGVAAPAVLVLDKAGHRVAAFPLPADDAALAAALKGVMP